MKTEKVLCDDKVTRPLMTGENNAQREKDNFAKKWKIFYLHPTQNAHILLNISLILLVSQN